MPTTRRTGLGQGPGHISSVAPLALGPLGLVLARLPGEVAKSARDRLVSIAAAEPRILEIKRPVKPSPD